MAEIFEHTIEDSIKLLPFLFVTYLVMEYLEHTAGSKINNVIRSSGKFGPLAGSLLGLLPQCGFSVMATNLYMGRILTTGTLIAIYLATSDEMLPILISEKFPAAVIAKILFIKFIVGVIAGFSIDYVSARFFAGKGHEHDTDDFCEQEHCGCEDGILKPALKHTVSVFAFIFAVTFVMNLVIHTSGEDILAGMILNHKILGPVIASLVGLIPNCASSVILTQLYVQNVISGAIMISGLLVNAGVGLLVLFRVNRNLKENLTIISLLCFTGVVSGIIMGFMGIVI